MEHLASIRRLLEFQRVNGGSMQPLVDFIAEDTLSTFSIIRLYLGIKKSNGVIDVPYANGNPPNFPKTAPTGLDEHTPGYDAYANGKIVELGDVHEYPFYHPENVSVAFPNGFEYSVIFPVPDFGAMLLFSSAKRKLDGPTEDLLYSVGEVVSNNLANGDHGVKFDLEDHPIELFDLLPLTPRQWAIKEAMLRGLTNGAIAREMNFSESLIRHETIRIYSKLNISGRKELFAMEAAKENNEEMKEA